MGFAYYQISRIQGIYEYMPMLWQLDVAGGGNEGDVLSVIDYFDGRAIGMRGVNMTSRRELRDVLCCSNATYTS